MIINLRNGNILVKVQERKSESQLTQSGIYIPEEVLEEEQVSQGIIIQSQTDGYDKGDGILFHKVIPVDVNLKLDGDVKLEQYFFISEKDVICTTKE